MQLESHLTNRERGGVMSTEIEIKKMARESFIGIYEKDGYSALKTAVQDFIARKTFKGMDPNVRNILKGECAEILITARIKDMQENTDVETFSVKGLCFTKLGSDYTTELDLTLFTPRRIYLFECKSYNGKKTLTREGYLKGRFSEIDVYAQSKLHAEFLWSRIGQCHIGKVNKSDPAFQMILMDVSDGVCEDLREPKYRRVLQYLNVDTLDNWFRGVEKEIQTGTAQWDIMRLYDVVGELHKNSAKMFQKHLAQNGGK